MPDARPIPIISYGTFSRRIHERAARDRAVIKAQWELTYRCNLHCRHCYTDPFNSPQSIVRELSRVEIEDLLDQMRDVGIVWLNLTGGDIFMHPEFFEIYESAYRRGFLLQLYTNGTLFTRAAIERLQRMPPFSIDVSCHSIDEGRFDWFTQIPGSYRAFRRGLELLRRSGLPVTLKTKLMNWNKDELAGLRAFTESFGQPFGYTTSLSPRLDGDCSSLAYRIDPNDIRGLEPPGLAPESEDSCDTHEWIGPPEDDRLFRCGCGTDTIHINAWGDLGTCTFQYETRVSVRTHTLREAIGMVFTDVREMRYRKESPCRTCTVHRWCDKQPTQARWETGDPQQPIPYDCEVAHVRAGLSTDQALISPLALVQGGRRKIV